MKTRALKTIILIALLTTVSLFSQSSPPERIQYNNIEGVFITLPTMDSISVKLIHRNFLLKRNLSLGELIQNLKLQNAELGEKFSFAESQSAKYKTLWGIAEQQKTAALENFESQKIITSNIKAKARRNGLLYLGGGVSLGFLVFAVLVN